MAEIQEFLSSKAEKQLNRYEKTINNLVVVYSKLDKEATKLQEVQAKQAKTQQDLDNTTKSYNSLLGQLNTTSGKLAVAESGLNKELIKKKEQLRQVNKDLKSHSSLYATLTNKLEKNRAKAKEIGIQYGINSKQFKTAQKDVLKLNNQIVKLDASLGQHNRKVGSYTQALSGMGRSLIGSFGVVGGMYLFATAIKDVINIGKVYEKQNAVLASVLGKRTKETKELQEQSKDLGANTAFSATQVTELQTELARLGKTEDEILDSTEGIIDATLALGSETGETATLIGAALNAFGEDAEKSSEYADILTLSTQKSALSFDKLATAIPITSGAAAAAEVPFTTMIAQLGKAADRGIDASTAATSLRNIYIALADKGISLEYALRKINTSQNKLSSATELFGKRAAVTALALADTVEGTNDLKTALDNAGGTAKKVAETQLDTLDGQLKLLNSAWEGLVLNINNADTAVGKFSKNSASFLAKGLNQIANVGKEWELLKKSIIGGWDDATDELNGYIAATGRVKDSSGNIKYVKDILDEIAEGYKALTYEEQQYVDVTEEMAIALLKAGGEVEAVDGIVKAYLKNLNIEKKLLNDLNYEYNDSNDFLEYQKKNKEELNEITKESIKLADQEIERIQRQIELPDPIKTRGDQLRSTSEIQAEFTESAEESAQRTFEVESEIRQQEIQREQESFEAKRALKQLELDNSIDTAYNIANVATTLLGEQTVASKIAAGIQATISGYLGVQEAFTQTPGPIFVKIAAAASAGALAIKNLANIAGVGTSTYDITLPAYAKGTENTASTYLAGEAGRELRIDKRGNISLINDATIFANDAGSKIYSNQDTERILRGDFNTKQSVDMTPVVEAIKQNRSQMNVMLDRYGIINVSKGGMTKTKYVNNKFRNVN